MGKKFNERFHFFAVHKIKLEGNEFASRVGDKDREYHHLQDGRDPDMQNRYERHGRGVRPSAGSKGYHFDGDGDQDAKNYDVGDLGNRKAVKPIKTSMVPSEHAVDRCNDGDVTEGGSQAREEMP